MTPLILRTKETVNVQDVELAADKVGSAERIWFTVSSFILNLPVG